MKAQHIVTPWPGHNPPDRTEVERLLRAEGLSAFAWSDGPGDVYAPHSHSYNKVIYCVEGSITFSLPEIDIEVKLKVGDRLDLPAGIRHGAHVGPTGVSCLEAHQD